MAALSFRRLDPLNSAERTTWREVFRATPAFTYASEGHAPCDADADRLMDMQGADGRTDNIYIFALYTGEQLCGCAHIIRDQPSRGNANLTWLVIMEKFQRSNLAIRAFRQLENMAQSWGCQRMVGVVAAENERAVRFWKRLGMQEVRRERMEGFVGEVIICHGRPLHENAAMQEPATARLRQPL
jgi:RimJ/RimL family protein N-acetyltransferase